MSADRERAARGADAERSRVAEAASRVRESALVGDVRRVDRAVSALARAALGAAGLACAEVTLALLRGNVLFSPGDAAQYAVASIGVVSVGVLVATLLLALLRGGAWLGRAGHGVDAQLAKRRVSVAVFVLVAPLVDLVLWRLTSGRRVQALPGRELLVALAAGVAAIAAALLAARWLSWRRSASARARGLAALLLAVVVVACLAIDQQVLPRGYPAFHWALAVLAVLAATLAADLAALDGRRVAARALAVAVVIAVIIAGPALWSLRRSPNARYATEQRAPLTGKAVTALRHATPQPLPTRTITATPHVDAPRDAGAPADALETRGLTLADQSVLLVTIDALRADRLEAYGGNGLTPQLDALARESVVFRRAYTPTPHTSHALGSLFTGTFLRAVLTLPDGGAARPTIASLLRHAGFHTAAFYPPAVFFVDSEQLEALRADGFGFEHRTAGWASAPERARQVEQWLAHTPDEAPVFVWAHVFEPHEPYEPPALFARGASMVERYDGEVAAADAGVGELIRAFRARRPRGTVIVTADHGEEFGEHGGHYHGTSLYDEQARVPLLWSSPGAVRARSVDAPIELVDVAVTLLAALGVPPDPRMRGDDLGALLAGDDDAGPQYAFASVAEEWMVTDGRLKAICAEGEADCRLYDLNADSAERRNVAEARPRDVTRLRDALAVLLSSIPTVEAGDDARAPLARANLGDASAGPALVPLLGSPDAKLRAEAAAALALLRFAPSLPSIIRLRRTDLDAAVRDEAAITAFVLGDGAARAELVRIATETTSCADVDGGCPPTPAVDRSRRAALALAAADDASGARLLLALASDSSAREAQRTAAIAALGRLRVRGARAVLEPLLADLVLRTVAADALGALGDRRAGDALVQALGTERYLSARSAEARALVLLRDRRAIALIRAELGSAQALPEGVALLQQAGDLARPSVRGADVSRSASVRRGVWRCVGPTASDGVGGCVPLDAAQLALPRSSAPVAPLRLVLRVNVVEAALPAGAAHVPATLAIGAGADPLELRAGVQELAVDIAELAQLSALPVIATGEVRVVAVAVVTRAPSSAPRP